MTFLGCSLALCRFVNSLVDPLQTTYYARSIASLAAQIGLPAWFVELRHQATHEDLPSIAVLRDAARQVSLPFLLPGRTITTQKADRMNGSLRSQALDWLYANYWLPALESASATSSLEAALPPLPLSTLRPLLLTTYKSLAKQFTRDASLAGKLKADVQKTYKDIERWIADNSLGGGIRGGKKEEEARERALEAVAEILWEEGGLVPLAKKCAGACFSFFPNQNSSTSLRRVLAFSDLDSPSLTGNVPRLALLVFRPNCAPCGRRSSRTSTTCTTEP